MQIGEVRRFNRTVTEHIGALSDRFLGGSRPLGESRILWEIGRDGCTLRELRARLRLDSGYVSRVMRALEADGLVTLEPSETDGRLRVARLTRAGLDERRRLDERSDELARSLLEPLSEKERAELVGAMRSVERLLTAGSVEITAVDPTHPDAVRCIEAYFAELDRRSETGFDPGLDPGPEPGELRPPAGVMLVAYLHGEAVGCGALKHHADGVSEIKRLWVTDRLRGLGLGNRLRLDLEARAAQHGSTRVRLDTNRNLTEAIAMYRGAGYVEVPRFNRNAFAHHWFEKRL